MTPTQRIFLWNQLPFNSKKFDLFGIDNAMNTAIDVITFDDKMIAQNRLRDELKKLLNRQKYVNNALLIEIWNLICKIYKIYIYIFIVYVLN